MSNSEIFSTFSDSDVSGEDKVRTLSLPKKNNIYIYIFFFYKYNINMYAYIIFSMMMMMNQV